MTDEQINIAIAESVGWQPAECICPPHCTDEACPACIAGLDVMPNYCNDLNACAEMEKWLGQDWDNYWRILFGVVKQCYPALACNKSMQDLLWHHCIRATASQRAEAYLRMKGLWKE